MAFGRLVFYPGGTQAQYEAVVDAIGPAHADAPGRTFLAAGATEGGWEMITVWESKDAFDRWATEHLGPAHQRVGARGWQSPPEIKDFEPFHVLM